jgi:transcription-repair coupling factor (superfamily II helicase)
MLPKQQRLVPVEEAERLWRYGAEAEAVSLDRLDGKSWHKRREEIDAYHRDKRAPTVQLAAERAARTAAVLEPDVSAYERFSAGFAYSETPDQLRAIEAVRADLASGKPMDRLVVGDVGYGKTEVALRAACNRGLVRQAGSHRGSDHGAGAPAYRDLPQALRRSGSRSPAFPPVLAARREPKKGLADGSIRIVIGTRVAGKERRIPGSRPCRHRRGAAISHRDKARLAHAGRRRPVLTLTAPPIRGTLQGRLSRACRNVA